MAIMAWSPTLSVNVGIFDKQHMKLVEMVNNLHDGMKSANAKEILGGIINELVDYTTTHITEEEQLMTEQNYDGLADHHAEHAKFVLQIRNLKQQYLSGQTILTIGVMMFIKDWLVKHILGHDKKLGIFLNEKGII
jgi:hemerythrin